MIRSRARVPAPATAVGPGFTALVAFAAPVWLATVTPRDHAAEDDVKTAESDGQKQVGKTQRSQRGDRSQRQKRHPHNGHHTYGKRSARGNPGSIKKQPHGRQKLAQSPPVKDKRQ